MPDPTNPCPRCGALLVEGKDGAYCAACMIKGALDDGQAEAVRIGPGGTVVVAEQQKPGPQKPEPGRPGDHIGRYKLVQKLGEGGFGTVYMAEQEEPVRRRVALKVIKLGMDTKSFLARFEAERQALALMDHPNIAKVLDAGATDAGRPYFVMELVRGVPITDYCDRHNLSTGERLDLFTQVCDAIQHAHQKGIIHRDITPSNILVTIQDGQPVPKVIDFGIAKATAGQRLTDKTLFTAPGRSGFVGTLAYVSPEHAEMNALDIDTRSDIYSLGVLLYELLTGNTPFDAQRLEDAGHNEMCRILREEEPLRPSTRLTGFTNEELTTVAKRRNAESPRLIHLVRGDLDWIVMKCLEKDRTRRYETVNMLAVDVKRHLNNEPILARPPSTAYRLQKAWRRNKVVFTAVASVAVALVVGLTVSIWQAMRATKAGKAALRNLYIADMDLLQQAWEQNDVGRVRELLEETDTYPQRGFEWYYWQRQTHLDLKTLRGHVAGVSGVAFSPDGQRIVTGSRDQTAKMWEAASGKELFTLKGHSGGINSVVFSPDGQRIVTGSRDQTAKMWEAASGKELLTLKGHSGEINSVVFSPDGQRIVTGSEDQTAKVWEAASGKELLTLKGHGDSIFSVAFSPDGQRVVASSLKGTIQLWEAASGNKLLRREGQIGSGQSVVFTPDGRRILTCGMGGLKAWDAASGKELLTLDGIGVTFSTAFSPDGQRIVTGCEDRTAKVWKAAGGYELSSFKGHDAWIISVAFSPDGKRVVTGSDDNTAKVWEATIGNELLTLKEADTSSNSVVFSPDGKRIITFSKDQLAEICDVATGKALLAFKGHSNRIDSAAFSPDGKWIATGSEDRTAKVWDAADGELLLTLQGHSNSIVSVAFSPDGQRIVTGSNDGTVKVWEEASGKQLLTFNTTNISKGSLAFSPDGHRILACSMGAVKVWEAASGNELLSLGGGRSLRSLITSAAFSPDGQRIVTGSTIDGPVMVWDAASGKQLLTLMEHSWLHNVAFSPDGQRIVSSSVEGMAKMWDTASGKELLTLKAPAPRMAMVSLAFSSDGQRILTCYSGGQVKVWDTARPEQVMRWQKEEKAAAERLVALERERTQKE